MARPGKVKPEQAREHEARAWALRQQGWTQQRIAAELGLGQSAVCRILARVSRRTLKELSDDVGRVKAEQSERLDFIIDEALQAWERSKRNSSSVTRERTEVLGGTEDEQPARERVVRAGEQRDGDVRFLEQARAALAEQRKIWGAEAPKKAEISGRDGGPIETVRRYVGIDPDEV